MSDADHRSSIHRHRPFERPADPAQLVAPPRVVNDDDADGSSYPSQPVRSDRPDAQRDKAKDDRPTLCTASPAHDRDVCLEQTNRPVQGLVSIDRSKVAALLSTTPRPRPKSSTNDLVLDLDTVNSRFTTVSRDRYVRIPGTNSRLSRGSKSTPSAERGRLGHIYASR